MESDLLADKPPPRPGRKGRRRPSAAGAAPERRSGEGLAVPETPGGTEQAVVASCGRYPLRRGSSFTFLTPGPHWDFTLKRKRREREDDTLSLCSLDLKVYALLLDFQRNWFATVGERILD